MEVSEEEMSKLKFQKGADVELKFKDGFARTTMLPDACEEVDVNKCVLRAGHTWEAELYNFEDKVQIFYFVDGKGYITLPDQAFNITEQAVFVPYFDKDKIAIKAATNTDLEFLQFVCRQSEFDKKMMNTIRTTLPRFKLESECETYEEPFKGPGTKSPILIMHRLFGRYSMGSTIGDGPTYVGPHAHDDLIQYYYPYKGSRIQYTADGETVEMTGGDLSFIPESVEHSNKTAAGDKCDYVWFEVAINGYQL